MKLADYLHAEKIKPADFAAIMGVPPSTVTRWIKGERKPRSDAIAAIERATSGRVKPTDFASEREAIREIELLTKKLTELEGVTPDEALVLALKEAIGRRKARSETASETAARILREHGITLKPSARRKLPDSVYHDLDHKL